MQAGVPRLRFAEVKIDPLFRKKFPGLIVEKSGASGLRYRVRQEGRKDVRILLTAPPYSDLFIEQYYAARAGVNLKQKRSAVLDLRSSGLLDDEIAKMLARCRNRAKDRGWPFDLTSEWFWGQLERQDGKCAVSNAKFDLAPRAGFSRRPWAPSIDRLDNSKGYTTCNVRLTTVMVNTAMSDYGQEAFIQMCRQVAAYQGSSD